MRINNFQLQILIVILFDTLNVKENFGGLNQENRKLLYEQIINQQDMDIKENSGNKLV